MIDFSLTDKQLAVRDMARELARRVVAPTITEYDRRQQMNPEVLPAMREANLLGFCIPEEYGGLGTDYISLGLASEELEYADTSARVILSVHIGLFSLPVLTWANEAQKRKYLVPTAREEKIATF
ncbi:MAG TPA: acyl-CoA dehydrogenase family protein, partial [candidate division Zixibacteria bacterium]|nr:acyl-CoA dehydrogenase family protein [candidate division Zixibacteria bacterium]